MIALKDFN